MFKIPAHIIQKALEIESKQDDPISCFIYDLRALSEHVKYLKQSLPNKVSLYYAIKANNDRPILNTITSVVDGLEVSSGGEIKKIKDFIDNQNFIFSGPGKLDSDLKYAINKDVEFIHIESLNEIERLNQIANTLNIQQKILLRINPTLPKHLTTKLAMAGKPTPFGIDEQYLSQAVNIVENSKNLQLCGFHIHAMSHQTNESLHLELIDWYLHRWAFWKSLARSQEYIRHLNVGGGIGVRYLEAQQFNWADFCENLSHKLLDHPDAPLIRFEIGRFVSAFCGYYIVQILDIKHNHGKDFLVCRGGTHQFRLPVAQKHNHPVIHIPLNEKKSIPRNTTKAYTVVGQLCTPKDVLSKDQVFSDVQINDLLILPMAGAYGFNISHKDFLCHPYPQQYYIN